MFVLDEVQVIGSAGPHCFWHGELSAVFDADRPFILSPQLTQTGICVCVWLSAYCTCLCHYLPLCLCPSVCVMQAAAFNSSTSSQNLFCNAVKGSVCNIVHVLINLFCQWVKKLYCNLKIRRSLTFSVAYSPYFRIKF